jgi:hypothetical protein
LKRKQNQIDVLSANGYPVELVVQEKKEEEGEIDVLSEM